MRLTRFRDKGSTQITKAVELSMICILCVIHLASCVHKLCPPQGGTRDRSVRSALAEGDDAREAKQLRDGVLVPR